MVRDHRTGEVHIPHETVAIPRVTTKLGRTLFKIKRQAGGESILLADDLAGLPPADSLPRITRNDDSANGHLVTPVYVKSLPVTMRRKTAKPARIASQQSLGQEPEPLLAALSLGALFILILTSVLMKLFIG